jgi:putative NIF3 family GTP cyclohydrolase 1 type 2
LKIRTMRVLGDPRLPVKRVLASWGNVSQQPGIPFFARPDVDVLVVGETHEWELVEYAQDTIAAGQKKALIVLGHVVSEQAGMKYCAEWLKEFIKEVPIEFIAAAEPFWRPDKPVG